jgi:hypothetical protein
VEQYPVPTEINVSLATADGEPETLVVLTFSTPIGENSYFLSIEAAQYVSGVMQEAATDASSGGIVAVKNQLIVPNTGQS